MYVDYQYGTDNNTSFNKLLKNVDVYNGTSDKKSTRYAITYDEIGNPTKYEKISYDDKGVQVGDTVTAASLNWRGRQLMKLTDSVNSNTISYLYDADGLRGSKTVNGAKTTYTYVGDKLCYQHTANADGSTNYELYFFYDCKGALSVLQYYIHSGTNVNGYTYYVASNAFGDVTGLYGADGVLRVAYEYDAWGNLISVTDADENGITNPNSIAHRNPIRYRGYYYDTETGFYYLQSRYYCPKIGRFINADTVAVFSLSLTSIRDKNLFSYCNSNPICRADSTGHFWNVVIGAVVGGAIGGICTALTGGSKSEVVVSVLCGAVAGGLAATGIGGLAGQILIGAVTSCIDSGYQNYNDYASGEKTARQAITSTVVDTAMGATFGAMGFDGTEALKTSNKMVKNTHNALKRLNKDVVHPTVKANAKKVLKQSRKYLISETKEALVDEIMTNAVGYGIGEFAELYY